MIGMRVSRVDGREPLFRFENLGRQLVRLAERELRIDEEDVPLADDHRRVDVVADLPAAGVNLQSELRLCCGGRHHHGCYRYGCCYPPDAHSSLLVRAETRAI